MPACRLLTRLLPFDKQRQCPNSVLLGFLVESPNQQTTEHHDTKGQGVRALWFFIPYRSKEEERGCDKNDPDHPPLGFIPDTTSLHPLNLQL
jgi:hypothetical protein